MNKVSLLLSALSSIVLSALLLSTVLTLAGCQEAIVEQRGSLVEAVIIAETSVRTRTQIAEEQPGGYLEISWSPSDGIGTFGSGVTNARFDNSLDIPAEHAIFKGKIAPEGIVQYAYYPYREGAVQHSAVPVSIHSSQDYTNLESIGPNDIKASNEAVVTEQGTHFSFHSLGTMLRIIFDAGSYSGLSQAETLRSISISAPGDRNVTGDFLLNLEDMSLTPSASSSKLTVNAAASPGLSDGADTLYAVINPDIKMGDRIDFEVYTSTYRFTFHKKAGTDFKSGTCYNMTIDLGKCSTSQDFTAEKLHNLPVFTSFKFKSSNNTGKILDKEVYYSTSDNTTKVKDSDGVSMEIDSEGNVSGCIPYLYNFNLIPDFTLSSNDSRYKVMIGDKVQTSGSTTVDFSKDVIYTIYDSESSASADYKVSISNTGLPIVVLTLNNTGTYYLNGWNYFLNTYLPAKTADYGENDRIAIYDENGVANVKEMDCGIRHRGNFSMRFPKKAMNIKLSSKASVLGMKKHKRWTLLANYNDRSMLRNAVAFEIARRVAKTSGEDTGLDWQPSGRFVELVFNGMHVGTYFLCEHIRQDKNRVAVSDGYDDRRDDYAAGKTTEPPTYANCGYLLEMDNNSTDYSIIYGSEPWYFRTQYCYERALSHIPVISHNEYDQTEEGQVIWTELKSFVNTADGYIFNSQYANAAQMVDMTSASDYMLVMEMTMNHEYMHPKSVYLHKDGEGKLFFGPVWDFDVWTFPTIPNIKNMGRQIETYPNSYSNWQFSTESTSKYFIWYRHLLKQSDFVNLVKGRWSTISSSNELTPDAIDSYIQNLADQIELSMTYNDRMWPRTYNSPAYGYQNGDEWKSDKNHTPYTFSESVELLKKTYRERYSSMSSMVNSLNTKTIGRN